MSIEDELLQFASEQSLIIKNLLDQIGLAYHRVFSHNSVEVFHLFLQKDYMNLQDNSSFLVVELSAYLNELSQLNHKLIYLMDELVLETLKEKPAQNIFNRILNRPNELTHNANKRFNQIITPVIENVFLK
ncbi:hypothetical protein [Pseudoalteromonas denitrificans]|uniref:hypothetical protein n=1 Tax=Pseudoalteromonas denitrificans TaxID=43656 RepID=UPI0011606516|nr:hypothetical protein [Pseudoalteromonas denitrificans]